MLTFYPEAFMAWKNGNTESDFVNAFMLPDENTIDNIPTCGVVAFQSEVDHWKDVQWGKNKILFFDFPKSKTN